MDEQLDGQTMQPDDPLPLKLRTSFSLADQSPVAPDAAAEVRRAQTLLNIPEETARANPQEVIRLAKEDAFDYDAFARDNPTSAKYFAQFTNAEQSRDDVQPVANLEQTIRQFNKAGLGASVMGQAVDAGAAIDANNPDKLRQDALQKFGFKGASILSREIDRQQALAALPTMQAWDGKTNEFTYGDAVRKGVGTVKLTWDFLADRLAGALGMDQTDTRRILNETSAYLDGLGKDFETELAFERAREGGGGSIPGTIGALGSAVAQSDDLLGVVGKFMTEQLVASVPGALLGGVAAAPARAAAQTYIRNELVAKGVSTALAGASASATAVVVQSLGSNYKEGVDQGMSTSEAASRAWTKTLAEVPANAIAGAAIGLRIGPNALANVFAQTAIQGVGGGVGAASASLAVGEAVDPLEVALEIVGEGVGAAPDMVIAGATMPQVMQARADAQQRMADRQEQIAQTENNAAQLQSVLAAAAASQTRVRDPETFAQLVQDAAEDSGTAPTELFIDAQPLLQILTQSGMTPEQIAELLPSVAEQLDEALATDGSVVIPVGEAVTAFADTGFEQELVRNARVDADAISPADAEAAKASLQELDAEAQQIIAEQQEREAWETSSQVVFDQMNAELNAAGRFTPDVNQVYATVVRDFYTVLAGKLGQMPDQVWARYRIPVTETSGRAGAALDQGGVFDWSNPGGRGKGGNFSRDTKLGSTTISYGVGKDGTAEIISVRTPQAKRGQGAARQALTQFLMEADAQGLTVKLQASPLDKKTNLAKLVEFYSSLGFELTGKKINAAGDPEMVRQPQQLNQSAFHGSPYRFDKFTLDAIGTGEGAQAYGWGLYFASDRNVSEFYRQQLSANRDVASMEWRLNGETVDTASEMWSRDANILQDIQSKGYEQAVADVEKRLADRRAKWPEGHSLILAAENILARLKKYEGAVVEYIVDVKEWGTGQLYRVEIPEDDQFLLWDEPLSNQPEQVRAALEKAGVVDFEKNIGPSATGEIRDFGWTKNVSSLRGEELYRRLVERDFTPEKGATNSARKNSEKETSLYLNSIGIAGVKYLDGMSRGGTGDNYNYVVFDDQAVQIAETFYQSNPTPLPATIGIDGVQRSTVNSNGQPLAQTEEGVRNFWSWFGDSKVVDAQGRPLVVYHGTNGDFTEFNTKGRGKTFDAGSFFTTTPAIADTYTAGQNGNVMPVYLRISNLAKIEADGQNWARLGKKTKVSLPKAVVSDQEDADLEAELTGVPAPQNATKTLKARNTSLAKLFPDEFLFDDYFSTDDLSRWVNKTGYDGAIFENILDRGANGRFTGEETQVPSTVYTVFDPTQIKSATGNRGTFDPNDPSILNQPEQGGARAQFNPATLEISLLEKADLSSFLHELGHAFFEITAMVAAQPNAPQTLVDDMQTLFNATGYTGTLQEWLATPVSERRIAHETVAESFEQYLIDGKAPSIELQSLFERMRTWMLRVYQTLQDFLRRNPNANLTDEVRGVFDRMLATDEAIAAAKVQRAAMPLFTSAEQAGMTPEQFADYLQAAGEVDQDAIRDLDSRSIRDMKWLRAARDRKLKELQKDAAAKRRNARIEARRQLLQEPVYRAVTFLRGKVEPVVIEKRSGKDLDPRRDDLVNAIAKLGGLNREQAVAEFGIDPADFPTRIVGSPTLRAGKAGRSPDMMAEILGERGYLQPREGGRYDLRDLGDLLHEAARGVPSYSLSVDYDLIHGYKMVPVPGDADENPFGAGRLSLPELTERFAGTDVDFMKLGVGRRGMIADVGMPMDAVAEIVGFKTGEEMVRALIDVEPLQSATEGLTDKIMLERYGDLSSDDAIERAADAALANDARTRMVATEFAALNMAVGSVRAVQAAARQTASTVVARQKIRNVRPDKSAAAVARAGKGAEAALRKGERDTAAGFKRSQVLNAAIEREQRKTRTEIDKAVADMRAMFGNDKGIAKSRDMNLVNAAREAVARYGLAPEVGGQRAAGYLEVLARENPAMAEQMEAITSMLPEPKPYRELTVEEFRSLRDSVLGLYQLSRRVMQTRIDGKLVDIDEAATPIVEAVIARAGGELPGLLGYDGTITDAQKLKVGLLGFKAAGTRVEQWSDAMGAEVKRLVYQQVSDAAVQARLARTDMIKRYREVLKLAEPGMTYEPINAPELGDGGFVFTRGKQELLHALLHTGNPSNLRKLLLGRGWGALDADGNLDTAKWDSFLSRMIGEGLITKADYDFAQGVWDLLETVKRDAQKAHFDIFGFYFNEVTAEEIETPFGVYQGGYVPAMASALSSADQAQKREAEQAAQGGNSFMFPTTGKGFTQARVEYNRPLELDLRTIASHLDKVARFAYLEPAVKDTARLMMNKRVARALNGLDTNLISKMINPWLQRTAQQTTTVPTRFPMADKFFRTIRTRAGMYIMFANVINTAQQLTGFSVAAVKVPAPKLLRALKAYVGDPKETTRQAMALSPWLRDRLDKQGFEMTQQIEEILTNPSLYRQANDFMKRHAYFMQTGLQNVMDVAVWWGAFDHARSQGVNEKQAVRYADETIRTTQGTFSPEDVSGIEVQSAFVQLFTQFWGYFNMLANTLGSEAGKTVREMGYMASTPRLLGIWFMGLMIPAFVGQLIAQGAPDDEDDEDGDGTLDEWLAMFFGSQASTLAAMVPVLGQAATLAFNQFDDKVYNDRLNISPALSMIESAAAGASALLQGEAFDDRLLKSEVRNVAILVAMATGMPTNVVAKPVGYVLDVEAGRKQPDNAAEYGIGLVTGR